jgi:hypothetical protein
VEDFDHLLDYTISVSNPAVEELLRCDYMKKFIYSSAETLKLFKELFERITADGLTAQDVIVLQVAHMKAHELFAGMEN